MRVNLDENVTVEARGVFVRFGHDADTVVEEGLVGASDDVVRQAAADAGRMIVTFDVGFADVRAKQAGVVLLRLADQQPATVLAVVDRLLTHHELDDFAGCIVVVTERLVRVRRPETGGLT